MCRWWIIDQLLLSPKPFASICWNGNACTYLPALVVSLAAPVSCIHNSHWSVESLTPARRQAGHSCQRAGSSWSLVSLQLPKTRIEKFPEFPYWRKEMSGLELWCSTTNYWEVSLVIKKNKVEEVKKKVGKWLLLYTLLLLLVWNKVIQTSSKWHHQCHFDALGNYDSFIFFFH